MSDESTTLALDRLTEETAEAIICTLLGIARSTLYYTVAPLAKQNTQKRKKHG